MKFQKIVYLFFLLALLSNCKVFHKSTIETFIPNEEDIVEDIVYDEELLIPPPPPPAEEETQQTTTNNSKSEELYSFLNNDNKIDHNQRMTHSLVFKGKTHCVFSHRYTNTLWVFDSNNPPKEIVGKKEFPAMLAQATSELKYDIGREYANHTMGVSSLATVGDNLYFTHSNGRASLRLFQYQETGAKVIDGVTNINNLGAWNDKLVFSAVDDNDIRGLFTVGDLGKPELLLKCNPDDNNYLHDGIPYGYAHNLPIIDTTSFITVSGAPFIVSKSGNYFSFNLPKNMEINKLAQIEKGLLLTTSPIAGESIYLRLEEPTSMQDYTDLPDYMHGVNPNNLKSINKTAYFNLEAADGKVKSLYYKNNDTHGDLTNAFEKHDIKVEDLITYFKGDLIISKLIKLSNGWVYILQKYNPESNVLTDVTYNGKPMEISNNNGTFVYNNNLYFIGNDAENDNCLWQYDGINEPMHVAFSKKEEQ